MTSLNPSNHKARIYFRMESWHPDMGYGPDNSIDLDESYEEFTGRLTRLLPAELFVRATAKGEPTTINAATIQTVVIGAPIEGKKP